MAATSGYAAIVSAVADEKLGRTLTISIDDIANDSLGQRVAKKVQTEAAKAGYARVGIVHVERDGILIPASAGGSRSTGSVVAFPDGSSFSAPSAGPGFKLRRVSGEVVVREVVKQAAGS